MFRNPIQRSPLDGFPRYIDYLTIMTQSKRQNAAQLWMEIAPQMMRRMRTHVIESSVGTLTMPQYRILANINRGLNSIGAIAEHHGVAQPSMSKMIGLMEERGLIKRETSSIDKRQSVLSLTEKGRELFLKVRGKARKRLSEKLEEISDEEVQRLSKSFEGIRQVLEKWK
jgi:DNA-binding MarR family transcriptional regulator